MHCCQRGKVTGATAQALARGGKAARRAFHPDLRHCRRIMAKFILVSGEKEDLYVNVGSGPRPKTAIWRRRDNDCFRLGAYHGRR